MDANELQARIEKNEIKIQKIEKRIAKWTRGMNAEARRLVAACEVTDEDPTYDSAWENALNYQSAHKNDPTVVNQADEYSGVPNMVEAMRASRDLALAKATLENNKAKLAKIDAFNKTEKIGVVWDFLQKWKEAAHNFYVKNVKRYEQLKQEYSAKREEYRNSDEFKRRKAYYGDKWSAGWNYVEMRRWEQRYYEEIDPLTLKIYRGHGTYDDAALNKALDKEVQNKYEDFIQRVMALAGNIEDASGLRVAGNGIINGTVIGDKATVNVRTILAGGYNIQKLHFRVLVHTI